MRKKVVLREIRRGFCAVLSLLLMLMPLSAFAADPPGETLFVSAFALGDDVRSQTVTPGAKAEALTLPETLAVTADGIEGVEISGVTWVCDAYDAETGMVTYEGEETGLLVSEYIWTAVLPTGYAMAEGIAPPVICAAVSAEPLITVSAFALSDAIRYQTVAAGAKKESLILPETLAVTADGIEGVEISGVTWVCDAYDAETGMVTYEDEETGLLVSEYVWTAVLPAGYAMAEGTALPLIFALAEGGGSLQTTASSTVTLGSDTAPVTNTVSTIQTALQSALDAAGSGDSVTVDGNFHAADAALRLHIPDGVTLIWDASLQALPSLSDTPLLDLTGLGDSTIRVTGNGFLDHLGSGRAVSFDGDDAEITLDGGVIRANSGGAVYMTGKNASLTVTGGGSIFNYAPSNVQPAVYMFYDDNDVNTSVIVDNGSVSAMFLEGNDYAIQTYGNVEIKNHSHIMSIGDRGRAINALGDHSTVTVTDSRVWSDNGIVIHTSDAGARVNINGSSEVYSDAENDRYPVIFAENGAVVTVGGMASVTANADGGTAIKTGGAVRVEGGAEVSAMTGSAVSVTGDSSSVTVAGGGVFSSAGRAVTASGQNAQISIEGTGIVSVSGGTNYAVYASGSGADITVKDSGSVFSSSSGAAVRTAGAVSVSGGRVSAGSSGNAVETTGSAASVSVSGGVVSATTGYAINTVNTGVPVSVTGGFVFAYGTAPAAPGSASDVINRGFTLGSPGIVTAWNEGGSSNHIYEKEGVDDLSFLPSPLSAGGELCWDEAANTAGIRYQYDTGVNTGFFPLPVHVSSGEGLIFDAANPANMYINVNDNRIADPGGSGNDEVYTGGGWSWNVSSRTLTLTDFYRVTRTHAALTLVDSSPSTDPITIQFSGNNHLYADLPADRSSQVNLGLDAVRYGIDAGVIPLIFEGSGVLSVSASTEDTYTGAGTLYGIKAAGVTLEGGLLQAGGLTYSENITAAYGADCEALTVAGGTVELYSLTGSALRIPNPATDLTLPNAYTHWESDDLGHYTADAGNPFAAADGPYRAYGSPYAYSDTDQVIRISAGSFAAVTGQPVTGLMGSEMAEQTATVNLYHASVTSPLTNDDVSGWFPNLPLGVTVTASSTAADPTVIQLTFDGRPSVISRALFNITVPAGTLEDASGAPLGALAVRQDDNTAKFDIGRMYAILYSANGGSGVMASELAAPGAGHVIKQNTFSRPGYTFSGWNTAANGGGASYAAGAAVSMRSNLTLYAQWAAYQSGDPAAGVPLTGDGGQITAWITLLAASSLGLLFTGKKRRKTR